MLNVRITLSGDQKVIKQLYKTSNTLHNWSFTLRKVGDLLIKIYGVYNFETTGAYIGHTWAELKPSTIRYKVKRFPGRDILQATQKMQYGWKYTSNETKLSLTNIANYAHWHQTGTKYMAQRPLIGVNDRIKNDIMKVFKADLARKLQEAFR